MLVNLIRGAHRASSMGAFILFFASSLLMLVFVFAILIFPPILTVGLLLVPLFFVFLWIWPWHAICLYVLAILFLPDNKIQDTFTMLVYLELLARALVKGNSKHYLPNYLKRPVSIFAGIVALSFIVSVFYFNNSIPYMYRDGRVFLYWLWLPLLYFSFSKTPEQAARSLTRLMLVIGCVVSASAIFQFVTGENIVGAGQVMELETHGIMRSGFYRVQMPGFMFVATALVWTVIAMRFKAVSCALGLPLLFLFAFGLFVNFGRALWFWTIIALIFSAIFVGKEHVFKYIVMGLVLCSLVLGATMAFKPDIVDVVIKRTESLKYEGGHGTSFGWRILEYEDSVRTLKGSPIVGVGIGGEYRRWISAIRNFEEHTRYVHNGFLFMALKIGIPAVALFLYLFWRLWREAFRTAQNCNGETRVALTACLAIIPAFLGISTTQPEVMSNYGVLFYALLVTWIVILLEISPQNGCNALKRENQNMIATRHLR